MPGEIQTTYLEMATPRSCAKEFHSSSWITPLVLLFAKFRSRTLPQLCRVCNNVGLGALILSSLRKRMNDRFIILVLGLRLLCCLCSGISMVGSESEEDILLTFLFACNDPGSTLIAVLYKTC